MTPANTDALPVPISLKEVGALLVKHYDLHEGLWDVAVEIQVAVGQLGMPPDPSPLPGAMFRISKIGLTQAPQFSLLTVNAAEINPLAT
jgi:hypothetical protein